MYEAFGKLFIWLVFLPINVIVRGYTVSWIWLWFIVPIWGWQPLSISQSIGVSLVSSVLTTSLSRHKLKTEEQYDALEWALLVLVSNAIILGYAYLLHQFI